MQTAQLQQLVQAFADMAQFIKSGEYTMEEVDIGFGEAIVEYNSTIDLVVKILHGESIEGLSELEVAGVKAQIANDMKSYNATTHKDDIITVMDFCYITDKDIGANIFVKHVTNLLLKSVDVTDIINPEMGFLTLEAIEEVRIKYSGEL